MSLLATVRDAKSQLNNNIKHIAALEAPVTQQLYALHRELPGDVACTVDHLVDPADVLAIATAATGEQWNSNEPAKFAELTAFFSSRDVFVASLGLAAPAPSGKAKQEPPQVPITYSAACLPCNSELNISLVLKCCA